MMTEHQNQFRIKLKTILDAGIELNTQYGISPMEQAELAESEYLIIAITPSGQVGLYHEPCNNAPGLMAALNGVSAGGYLNRSDPRNSTLKRVLATVTQ